MRTIYIALMKWAEREEPICAGTNRRQVAAEALRRLKVVHGTGPVCRGQAMCSMLLTAADIRVVAIPFLTPIKQ